MLSTRRTSAGTWLPVSRSTTSPGTRSRDGTVTKLPSRSTWALGAAIFLSAASASSARPSCMTPRMALRMTMAMIAAASTNSVISPVRLNSRQPRRAETTAATMRMMTRNWLNWSRSMRQKPRRGASFSSFRPNCSWRCRTSGCARPRWRSLRRASAACAGLRACHVFCSASIRSTRLPGSNSAPRTGPEATIADLAG